MASMAEKQFGKTLFVRNIPLETTNEKLTSLFEDFGPIKQCFVVKDKQSDKCKGYGYVKFALHEDATKAKQSLHYRSIDGKKIFISHADHSHKKSRKRKLSEEVGDETGVVNKKTVTQSRPESNVNKDSKYLKSKIVVLTGFTDCCDLSAVQGLLKPVKKIAKVVFPVEDRSVPTAFIKFKCVRDAKSAIKKLHKKEIHDFKLHAVLLSQEVNQLPTKVVKRSRLIIRNLPFKVEEAELKKKCEMYGPVIEAKIPTKPDGKKRGFGFVQFTNTEDAGRAVSGMNGAKLYGRPLAVDWSLTKTVFEQIKDRQNQDEPVNDSDSEMHSSGSDDTSDSDTDESGDDSSTEEEQEIKSQPSKAKTFKKKSDICEGKTLFVRNVPFNCEEEDLRDVLCEFGEIVYCKLVKDPDTQHSRGTAFVQFKTLEAVNKCIDKSEDSGTDGGIDLHDRRLKISKAVERDAAKGLGKEKKEKVDKRNLFLVREGLIREGTQAAKGISKADLTKRTKIELEMRQKLKNPNIFVSSTRLCVQNLPTDMDDKALKKFMYEGVGDKSSRITECRIMRDMQRLNSAGIGKSRGYGFVNFSEHKHALSALHALNNKEHRKKRLILHFSLEDQRKLHARKQRQEKVLAANTASRTEGAEKNADKMTRKIHSKQKDVEGREPQDKIARSLYSGPKGLPSHTGAKIRHKKRKVPQEKKENQVQKGVKRKRPETFKSMEPTKKKKKKTVKKLKKKSGPSSDGFDRLVQSYKSKIQLSGEGKWFD